MSELESTPGIPDTLGVSISGPANVTAHDIIGRDKIIHGDEYIGYTAAQVTVLLDKIRTEYQSKSFDGRSPYVGLASFQERDADKFFGRETLTAELVTRVAASAASNARALFVAGPSGSGKSSLVRAGLVPALRRGAPLWSPVLGSEHWLYETFKPGRAPLDELARIVSSFANSPDAGDDFRAHASDDATRLHRWADIALKDDSQRRAVIVIDQFEEIFTQLTTPDQEKERVAFLNLLTHAATVENGRVLVIFTLRSDFVSNCASYPNLNALVNQQFIQVGAMTPDELVSAIARPAYQVGLRLDPALISQIVNDVRGEPGALPLMQFALQDLFEHEKQKGELTLDGYTARGGLHEALERHADAEFAKLDDAEKELARTVFSGLIEIGRGHQDTKRTANFADLVPAGADESKVQALVRELADARLITTDEQDGKETVTLAHERLIDAWDWLRRLVDENRDAIALQNEIAQDAQEWEQQKRDESYLYRGARLATAQEKLQQNKLVLSGLAQAYVEMAIVARERARAEREAARLRELEQAQALAAEQKQRAEAEEGARRAAEKSAAAEKGRARILRSATIALTVLLAVTIGTSVLAGCLFLQAREQERLAKEQALVARSRELAALAKNQFESSPDRAILIAAEANKQADAITFESEDALRELLFEYPLNTVLGKWEQQINSAHFATDNVRLVTAGYDGNARVWDAASGKELVVLRGHTSAVTSARFSHDGTRVVTAGCDKVDEFNNCLLYTARVWDAANGTTLAVLNGQQNSVFDAQFSPDDKWILTVGCEQEIENSGCTLDAMRLWDVAASIAAGTGKQLAAINGENVIASATFSPKDWMNGLQIVTTECERSTPTQPYEVSDCFPHTARVWSVAASEDSANIKEIAAVRVEDGGVIHAQFVATGSTNRVMVVTTDNNGQVSVSDAMSGKEIRALQGIAWDVTLAEISPDGNKLVTVNTGPANIARVWNLEDGVEIGRLAHQYSVSSAHFSPDGSKIVTASSQDQSARVWNASGLSSDLSFPPILLLPAQDYVASAEFSPDGSQIVTTGPNRGVQVWDARGGKELAVLRGHNRAVNAAQFSPDSTKIVTAGCATFESFSPCNVGTTRLWDAQSGQELAVLSADAQDVLSADFSMDGRKLVTNECSQVEGFDCLASTARIWEIANGKPLAALRSEKKLVLTARFSSDGNQVVTVECDDAKSVYCLNGTARLWDANNGALLGTVAENTPLSNAAFSPNGARLVTTGCDAFDEKSCTRGTARVWDISKLRETGSAREHAALRGHTEWVRDAQFSRDGARILTGGRDGTARVWDATSGKELEILRGADIGAITAQFSHDGTRILTANHGSLDRTVRVWDAASGKPIVILRGFGSGVVSARWSQDGTKIVTVHRTDGADYFVQVWDATNGARLALLRRHSSRVNSAQFSPDGTKIVTASDDGTARVYLVNVTDLIELAKQRVGRELDCNEREQYLNEKNVCPTPTPEASPTP